MASFKKRHKDVYRAIPVPPAFLETLVLVHDLNAAHRARDGGRSVHLWPWSRPNGRWPVRAVMRSLRGGKFFRTKQQGDTNASEAITYQRPDPN